MPRHRELVVLRGTSAETADEAQRLLAALSPEHILWVGDASNVELPAGLLQASPQQVRRLLGGSFDAVVLDLHNEIDADLLAQAQGFIWGGGSLVLRMPQMGIALPGSARLAVHPYGPDDVTHHLWRRLQRKLPAQVSAVLSPPTREPRGTAKQEEVVRALVARFRDSTPSSMVLVADRGRGKSSALGLALRQVGDLRAVVSAGQRESVAEVLRFAPHVDFVSPRELSQRTGLYDVICIDEAAQLPVPLLQRIVQRQSGARIAFATTARGYEGTGRGFVLRFLSWLQQQPRALHRLQLEAPIRWDSSDPLEAFIFDVLALDAEPAVIDATDFEPAEARHELIDRQALSSDEHRLRELFGLLVHAHYRTTPSDLHRILDAPNMRLHALLWRGHIVAVNLVALEGGLSSGICDDIAAGRGRIRGHALPDTLISHSGKKLSGALHMVRSVRIATHPQLRRHRLATRLTEAVHASYEADAFGTIFGATPELLRFRRSLGYELVRVGVSRGTRTGEPAAVMLRAVSSEAAELTHALRRELSRDLELQLELMKADLFLSDEMRGALFANIPDPALMDDAIAAEITNTYARGAQPMESAAAGLIHYVATHQAELARLNVIHSTLLRARLVDRRPWEECADIAGFDSVPAAMRALRRAVRELLGDKPGS